MDVRYFLGERLSFIEQLYVNSSAPFIERKRKIDAGEAPFVAAYIEDPEPAFLSEWLEAEESLQVIGRACVSMLSASFNLYFKTWEKQLGVPAAHSYQAEFKKGWLNGYKAYFQRQFGIAFAESPCNLDLLEELVLVRNRVQHPESLTTQSSHYSLDNLKKFPRPFFIDGRELEYLVEMGEGERSWLGPPTIHVTQEKLMAAISEVRRFAGWLEDTNHQAVALLQPTQPKLKSSPLPDQLTKILQPYAGQRLCVGFSGGLDSSVLLHLLAELAPVVGFQLSALHVHHGLSEYADDWAAHCARVAASLGVPLVVRRVSVARAGKGLEAAARAARHAALAEQACDWVVLAHHRGDQAETLLHRLMRGTGVQGAAGMRAVDAARRLLRPLLDVPRAELLAWAQQAGIVWIEDDSNTDQRFTRNFLRHDILPRLDERQHGVEANLVRAAGLFAESAELLDALAAEDLQRLHFGQPGSRSALRALGAPRARNLLRHFLAQAGELAPTAERLADALHQLSSGAAVRLPFARIALCAWRDVLWQEPAVLPRPHSLLWRGEAVLSWAGGELRFVPTSGSEALRIAPDGTCRIQPRQGGELLRVDPAAPQRDFKTLAQAAGVAPWQRDALPCVWQGDHLLWIGALGADAAARCAPGEAGWHLRWLPAA
jgi:tRNA(Ile)-lysidine synthase